MLVDNIIIKILISEQLTQKQKQDLLDAYENGNFKRAYRKFARVYHPDKNPDPSAKISFQDLGNIDNILGKVDDGLMNFSQAKEIILAQEEEQQQNQQNQQNQQAYVEYARKIASLQNIETFLEEYIRLCDMARQVNIKNAKQRINSAKKSAEEFLKLIDMITGPIDSRTKLAFYANMVDDFHNDTAPPGSGVLSYNLISNLDTGIDMRSHFYNLFVNLGYEVGYYEEQEDVDEIDEIGDMFDNIKNMKDFFYAYLRELRNYPDYSRSEKKTLKDNFIWLLNTWYKNVISSGFNDRYDKELEENLEYISNLGSRKENIRNKFKSLYYNAKRNRKKRKNVRYPYQRR